MELSASLFWFREAFDFRLYKVAERSTVNMGTSRQAPNNK
jgi:hypothetical protein